MHRTILIFSGIAALTISLTATAALATTGSAPAAQPAPGSWSVAPTDTDQGGSFIGPVVVTDPVTGGKIKCAGDVTFDITGGMGLTGALARIQAQLAGCTLPDGAAVTVTAGAAPWTMTGRTFSSATNLGVTTGQWKDVDLSISSSSCSGNLDGTAAGAGDGILTYQPYNNPGWTIIRRWGSNLHAYAVSGCAGLFGTGDPINVSATIDSGMTITSP